MLVMEDVRTTTEITASGRKNMYRVCSDLRNGGVLEEPKALFSITTTGRPGRLKMVTTDGVGRQRLDSIVQ